MGYTLRLNRSSLHKIARLQKVALCRLEYKFSQLKSFILLRGLPLIAKQQKKRMILRLRILWICLFIAGPVLMYAQESSAQTVPGAALF